MPRVQNIKANRAALVAKAAAGLLLPGEMYSIKDDTPATLAMATSTTAFNEYYNKAQVDSKASAVLPTQTGNSGKFLTTNGTATSWASVNASPITILLFGYTAEIDLSLGDYFRVEVGKVNQPDVASVKLKNYDGREKRIVFVNICNYQLDLNIVWSQYVETCPNFSITLAAYVQDANLSYYDCATKDIVIFGEAWVRMVRIGDAGTTRVYSSQIAAPTSLTRSNRTNNSMAVEWDALLYVPTLILAVQSTTFPSIDTNLLDPYTLNFSSNWADAATTQGVKCVYFGTDASSVNITGLGAYKSYSFAAYRYKRRISWLAHYGFSSGIQLINQKTLL